METIPLTAINPRRWLVLTVVVAAQFIYVVEIFICERRNPGHSFPTHLRSQSPRSLTPKNRRSQEPSGHRPRFCSVITLSGVLLMQLVLACGERGKRGLKAHLPGG